MPATDIDDLWFKAHPDREYRLRRQTPAELQRWPVPPREGWTGWCVIRREDGAMKLFALVGDDTWDDHDLELSQLFAGLVRGGA